MADVCYRNRKREQARADGRLGLLLIVPRQASRAPERRRSLVSRKQQRRWRSHGGGSVRRGVMKFTRSTSQRSAT
jgi:hypothetical protein